MREQGTPGNLRERTTKPGTRKETERVRGGKEREREGENVREGKKERERDRDRQTGKLQTCFHYSG